jgi:hypothetical protein
MTTTDEAPDAEAPEAPRAFSLVELGMSYVRAHGMAVMAPAVLEEIERAFVDVLTGQAADGLTELLLAFVGTVEPLQRITAILAEFNRGPLPPDAAPRPSKGNGVSGRKTPRRWTDEEDRRLLAGISRFGLCNWTSVAEFVGARRTRGECSQRWSRGLDPCITLTAWTPAEEKVLVEEAAKSATPHWMAIARKLGNRSDVQCRYHYVRMSRAGLVPPIITAAEAMQLDPRAVEAAQATAADLPLMTAPAGRRTAPESEDEAPAPRAAWRAPRAMAWEPPAVAAETRAAPAAKFRAAAKAESPALDAAMQACFDDTKAFEELQRIFPHPSELRGFGGTEGSAWW